MPLIEKLNDGLWVPLQDVGYQVDARYVTLVSPELEWRNGAYHTRFESTIASSKAALKCIETQYTPKRLQHRAIEN